MEMAPTTTDTPLRRSNAFRTPLQVPINNDDEEERRLSRRRTLYDDSTDTSITESSIEDNAQLQNFLKIYQENKISKDNAWNVGLIDTFAHMMAKHNKMMKNFQIVGSTLEASSKIYGLRVDSVHMDTVRMTAGLSRQKANARADDDNDGGNDQSMIEQNNEIDVNEQRPDRPQPKKKKTRRMVSTVTKNVDTINGKLDTVPFTDPVFAKLNSVVGNLYSTNRLLYSILPTANSQLLLRSDYLSWDFTPAEEITEFDDDMEAPLNEFKLSEELKENHVLRPRNGGYKILNTPADDDDEPDVLPESRKSLNHSAVAFDINAEVEPINSQPDFLDVDDHFEDELTTEDRFAIQACRGLRRPPVLIENLAPVDASSSTLEYSYRPLDNINQFWAGPSHWKFKKLSIAGQPVNRNSLENQGKAKKKRVTKKTLKNKLQELTFDDEEDQLLLPLDAKNSVKHANYKKWDPKKLKLPTNYKLERNCFDVFKYAQSLSVNACDVEGTVDIPSSDYQYDNAVDRDYCPNNNDVDTDDAASDVHMDHHQNDDYNENLENDNDLNATMAAISHQFEGAPNKVGKIPIPFSTRAKIVDMKRLKVGCLEIINEMADSNVVPISQEVMTKLAKIHVEKYKCGSVSFNGVYIDLPNKITQSMAENLSTATAFYSILHLANDYNLRLVQSDDLKDFQILRIE